MKPGDLDIANKSVVEVISPSGIAGAKAALALELLLL